MLIYCKMKWAENNEKLRKVIEESEHHSEWDYDDLIYMVIDNILNKDGDEENEACEVAWSKDIAKIDDGDFQGTILYLIHRETYQPNECEYLITYIGYGSCCVCDTLQRIQCDDNYDNKDKKPSKGQVNDYMTLCRDIVTRFKHPFNDMEAMEEA